MNIKDLSTLISNSRKTKNRDIARLNNSISDSSRSIKQGMTFKSVVGGRSAKIPLSILDDGNKRLNFEQFDVCFGTGASNYLITLANTMALFDGDGNLKQLPLITLSLLAKVIVTFTVIHNVQQMQSANSEPIGNFISWIKDKKNIPAGFKPDLSIPTTDTDPNIPTYADLLSKFYGVIPWIPDPKSTNGKNFYTYFVTTFAKAQSPAQEVTLAKKYNITESMVGKPYTVDANITTAVASGTTGNIFTTAAPSDIILESVNNYIPTSLPADGQNNHVHFISTGNADVSRSTDIFSQVKIEDVAGPENDKVFSNYVLPYLKNKEKQYVDKVETLQLDSSKPVVIDTIQTLYEVLEYSIIKKMSNDSTPPDLNSMDDVTDLISDIFPKAQYSGPFSNNINPGLKIKTTNKPLDLRDPELVTYQNTPEGGIQFFYMDKTKGQFFGLVMAWSSGASNFFEDLDAIKAGDFSTTIINLLNVTLPKYTSYSPWYWGGKAYNLDSVIAPGVSNLLLNYKLFTNDYSSVIQQVNQLMKSDIYDFDLLDSGIPSEGNAWSTSKGESLCVDTDSVERMDLVIKCSGANLVTVQIAQNTNLIIMDLSECTFPNDAKIYPDSDSVQLSQQANQQTYSIGDQIAQVGSKILPASIISIENRISGYGDYLKNSADQIDNLLYDIHTKFRAEFDDDGQDFLARIVSLFSSGNNNDYESGDYFADDVVNVSKLRSYSWSQDLCQIYSNRFRLYVEPVIGQLFLNLKAIAHAQPLDYVVSFTKQIVNVINSSKSQPTQIQALVNSMPSTIATWKQNISNLTLFPDHESLRSADVSKSKLYDILDSSFKTHSLSAIDQAQELVKYILSYKGSELRADVNAAEISLRCEAYASQQQSILNSGLNADVPSLGQMLEEVLDDLPQIISSIITTLAHAVLSIGKMVISFLSDMDNRIGALLGLSSPIMIDHDGDPVDALSAYDVENGSFQKTDTTPWLMDQSTYARLYSIHGNPQVSDLSLTSLIFYSRNKDVIVVIDGANLKLRVYSSTITGTSTTLDMPFIGSAVSSPSDYKAVANIVSYSTAEGIDKTGLLNVAEAMSLVENLPATHSWLKWLNPLFYAQQAIEAITKKTVTYEKDKNIDAIVNNGMNLFLSNIIGSPDPDAIYSENDSVKSRIEYSYAGYLPNFRISPISGIAGLVYEVSTVVMIAAIAATIITKGSFLGKIIHGISSISKFMSIHFYNDYKTDKQENRIVSEIGSAKVVDVAVKQVNDTVTAIAAQTTAMVASVADLKKQIAAIQKSIDNGIGIISP